MTFKMKYPIRADYIRKGTKRRSGAKMPRVRFIVAHDTGNDGSSAQGNVNYYKNSANSQSASAHLFVDHKEILECVPALTGTPEKAWHVLYNRTKDNAMYGDDSNDVAIGVELCYSWKRGSIDNQEAYKRYVWVLAYICYKFGLNPAKDITGHNVLDPGRKTDPDNALSKYGKNLRVLINDVVAEYNECHDKGYLAEGDRGPEVKALQEKLNKLGIDAGQADGIFGNQTLSAVILLQKRKGLTPDGLAGEATMAAIDEALGVEEPSAAKTAEKPGRYRVYTGTFATEAKAAQACENIAVNPGFNPFVKDKRVWTGVFSSLEQAEAAAAKIRKMHGYNPQVRQEG